MARGSSGTGRAVHERITFAVDVGSVSAERFAWSRTANGESFEVGEGPGAAEALRTHIERDMATSDALVSPGGPRPWTNLGDCDVAIVQMPKPGPHGSDRGPTTSH